MPTLKCLTPLLHTEDIEATIRWYENVLGFHCTGRYEAIWCRLERDGVSLMFANNDHFGKPEATIVQYVYVDDARAIFDELRERAAPEWGPDVMPYGNLEFAIRDPNGYFISFGQVLES